MISIYTGTPGAGKSLHIAQRIYYKLRSNKVVIANFDINLEKVSKKKKDNLPFFEVPNDKLNPTNLIRFSYEYFNREKKPVKEDTIFLVIDEAQIIFNSLLWYIFFISIFIMQHREKSRQSKLYYSLFPI